MTRFGVLIRRMAGLIRGRAAASGASLLPLRDILVIKKYAQMQDALIDFFDTRSRDKRALAAEPGIPTRCVLFAFQPWFSFDLRNLAASAWDRGFVLVVFDARPTACAEAVWSTVSGPLVGKIHQGVSLWAVCRYQISLELSVMSEQVDVETASHRAVIERVYARAVGIIERAVLFFERYQPDTVVYAQGYDLPAAILRHMAVTRGLRVIAIENTFHRERLLWDDVSGIAVNMSLAKNYYWRYRELVDPATAQASVQAYLRNIGRLKSAEHSSPEGALAGAIDRGPTTVLYIGQVAMDSSVLFGLSGFDSQVDVIAALAEWAAERTVRLVVKLHPKESPAHQDPLPYFRGVTARLLEDSERYCRARAVLGDRLLVDADNRLGTQELIQRASLCVTITSQAGLEALLLGKEVVLCGGAFYGGLGFTHEAADRGMLRATLDSWMDAGTRRNKDGAAGVFFHIYNELYCMPKREDSLLDLIEGRVVPSPLSVSLPRGYPP